MILKLTQKNVVTSVEYEHLSNLNISDKYKSLILVSSIFENINSNIAYSEYKEFLDSDRTLWHLSTRMSQTSE